MQEVLVWLGVDAEVVVVPVASVELAGVTAERVVTEDEEASNAAVVEVTIGVETGAEVSTDADDPVPEPFITKSMQSS